VGRWPTTAAASSGAEDGALWSPAGEAKWPRGRRHRQRAAGGPGIGRRRPGALAPRAALEIG